MESGSFQRWALKEVLVWVVAIGGGYLTFLCFEPLYDRAKAVTAIAGFPHALDVDFGVEKKSNLRVSSTAPLPLRGTLRATQTEPPAPHKVTVTANEYGHFHVTAQIKGQDIEFMTDTGATYVALSYETAQRLGLAPQSLRFNGRSTTANGVARVASIVLDTIKIGDITVKNVQAVVAEPGRMSQNLLGMSFIKELSGFELSGTTLTMKE